MRENEDMEDMGLVNMEGIALRNLLFLPFSKKLLCSCTEQNLKVKKITKQIL